MTIKLAIQRNSDDPGAPESVDRTFDGPIVIIGSDQTATLQLDAIGIAPEQAVIISEANQLLLINRAEGTSLNGEPLARETRRALIPGDQLQIGEFIVSLPSEQIGTGEASTKDFALAETPLVLETDAALIAPAAAEAVPAAPTPPQSFAAILDSLRTEEDSFYFLVEGGAQSGLRILLESAEMPLGWDEAGQSICFDPESIAAPRAVVRKDWSGVVVQAQGTWMITINGEMIESSRRLRNGDRVALAPVKKSVDYRDPLLIFHEPASLMVLDSLLPQRLPPPVSLQPATVATVVNSSVQPEPAMTAVPVKNKLKAAPGSTTAELRRRIFDPHRRYLRYYTLLDLIVFTGGTLVASLVVYLILHFTS